VEILLECIGFPPDHDFAGLAARVRDEGEPAPWRGPAGTHLRLPLTGGLELCLDQEEGQPFETLWPRFLSPHRVRVAVERVQAIPDSPFDALLYGTANPSGGPRDPFHADEYSLAACVSDRRRLPARMSAGHVLALGLAGFALDVDYCGPNDGLRDPALLDRPRGAWLSPLGGTDDPGGCMDLSLRVRSVRHLVNPLTGVPVDVLETDVPGRPLLLFVSRWQLEADGLPQPRPGWRIEGTFVLTGRVTGGLPSPARRLDCRFG